MRINKTNVRKLSWKTIGRFYRSGKATSGEKALIRAELKRCGYLMSELRPFWA